MEDIERRPRLRALGGRLARAVGCATAAGLVLLGMPLPAGAAPTPSVTITDVIVTEGSAGTTLASFTIKAAPRPRTCCSLSVDWASANGTALTPGDYAASSGTVSLTRAKSSVVVTVPVVGDTFDEANESFAVNLSGLVGSPGVIGDAQGLATITDDDPVPSLSIDDVTVDEGDAGVATATFTVSLSAASGFPISLDWSTVAGTATAGADFVTAGGTETIPAGSTTATIDVEVIGDTVDETNESYTVSLSNPSNATIVDANGDGIIDDDDPVPALSIDDVSLAEGDAGSSTATFTVTLAPASERTVSVDWTTVDDSAAQPSDYAAGSGSLTFVPGDTTETIDVTVNGDVVPELDETFTVALSNEVRASLGDGVGTGTIVDDELASVIDIDDPTVAEGDAGTTIHSFTVSLSNPSPSPVTVDWATAPGTAVGGIDYVDADGTVSFAAFDTSETIDVTVNGDSTYEVDEDFVVDLSDATNATIGDPQGTGTVSNDDSPPALSVDNVFAAEGDAGTSTLTFTVSLAGDSEVDLAVDYVTEDSSAVAGSDYTPAGGTLLIAGGDPSGSIDVTITGDVTYEGDERFMLYLSNPDDATIADGVGRGTIVNDDPAPVISIEDAIVTEGSGSPRTATFTLTIVGPTDLPSSVDWSVNGGSAASPSDYADDAGTVTFAPGDTSASIELTIKGDRLDERRETFTVELSNPVDAAIGDGTGVGRIRDDDKTPTTVTVQVLKGNRAVKAKGLLEPGKTGFRVTVTLFRKTGSGFAKVAATNVPIRYIRDRDHDGKKEGIYIARFTRPHAAGTYRFVTSFAGTSSHRPCKASQDFTLGAT